VTGSFKLHFFSALTHHIQNSYLDTHALFSLAGVGSAATTVRPSVGYKVLQEFLGSDYRLINTSYLPHLVFSRKQDSSAAVITQAIM